MTHIGKLTTAMLITVLAAATSVVSPAVAAQGERDHDRARSAVRAGQVLPLNRILAAVRQQVPGRVLDASLQHDTQRDEWRYEIKVLTSSGGVADVSVDARNGRIIGVR